MANIVNSRDVMLEIGTRTADIIKSVYITSSASIFTYDSSGALSPATQVLTLTATKANTSNTVNWVTSPVVPLYNAATAGSVASSGDTIYLRSADFNTAGVNSVQVIANVIDGIGLTSSIGITKQVAASGGSAGTSATNSTVVRLFQWSLTSPAGPTGTSTYTWDPGSNGTYSGINWTSTVPTNPGNVNNNLWIASKTVASSAANATVLIDWTGATISLSSSGLYTNNAAVSVYRWDSSAAVAPVITSSGTSVYTWATGAFTNPPTAWYAAPPVSPGAGLTLWAATVRITDATTSATTTINWTTASASPIGSTGTTGAAGTAGTSVRTAYARIPGNPTPISAFVTVSGDAVPTSSPSGSTWGNPFAVTWYTNDPEPASTDSLYVSDGLYDPAANSTVWSSPYITSLKVGSLSAVNVNTGALTVNDTLTIGNTGEIVGGKTSYADTTAGFFLGYDSANYKFKIGDSTSALTWDGSILSVPAATITGTLGSTQIADGVITTAKIASEAITTGKIAAEAITASKIVAGAINAQQIQLTTAGRLAGGKTSYADTTAGFFLGYDTDAYKLKIGGTDGLTFDGSTLKVGAITINGGSGAVSGIGTGDGQVIANNSDKVIMSPVGGTFVSESSSVTGAIKIRLPQAWTDTMLRFTVEIYEYIGGYSCTMEVAGYNYSGNSGSWLNVTARCIGSSNVEYPVFFGNDGTKACIWIALPTETWSYPQVRVRDFFAGYHNYARDQWATGWQISIDATVITSGLGTNTYYASVIDTLPGGDWYKSANRPANLVALAGNESIKNTLVTINANGTLGGAGAGAVTLNGVGYTGDTNATYGANWATNVTGASAVDTSIAAKLAKSGAQILTGPIGLDSPTAIRVGTAALDSVAGHDGFYIGSTGIVATKNGVATVSISTSGDATFKGDITGSSGNFSGNLSGANITGATGNFTGTLTAGTLDISKLVGQTTTFNSSGSIVCPADFTNVRVTIIGGGGGGVTGNPGGGGGGGGLYVGTFTSTPGATYTITVGVGGGYSSAGGSSSVTGTGISGATAGGGAGGSGTNGGAGGSGTTTGIAGSNGYSVAPVSGGESDPYTPGYTVGGVGGNSGGNYGAGGAQRTNGSVPGGGGGGGGGDISTAGTGGAGRCTVEFFNPNGVIIRSEWNALKSAIINCSDLANLKYRVSIL